MAPPPSSFDDQDWENFCLDPYQSAREEGEQLGRDAGLEAGFRDGHGMGVNTGTEYGMELGFFKGVCSAVEAAANSNQLVSEERIKKTVADLRLALDNFPGPDQVFREGQRQPRHPHTDDDDGGEHVHEHASEQDDDDDDDDNGDSEHAASESKKNILHKMQRIRARFKLLTVQLGIPHFSLKQVFDEAATSSATVTVPDTSDW
jgi:hypothetical protein